MEVIADLHLHSKYSRAVSPQMVIPEIAKWAKIKGIDLVSAPDWTHPLFFQHLKKQLAEVGEGVYSFQRDQGEPKFILATEISSIYSQGGKSRRIHNLVLAPSLLVAEKINTALKKRGVNLSSDGRPIISLSSIELADLVFGADQNCLIIPAHVWTPWYSLYGSKSGFDSLKECFGEYADLIVAIETGLSSDPAMNWRIGELDSRRIVSFSDAHSLMKLGREATVFRIPAREKISFKTITNCLFKKRGFKIAHTIEFYPEEGKYHWTGHRKCGVKYSPEETEKLDQACPVCGKKMTEGVMQRVDQLATRKVGMIKTKQVDIGCGLRGVGWRERPPYVMLVPLTEILAEVFARGVNTKTVLIEYHRLVAALGGELGVLLKAPLRAIAQISGDKVAEGVKKVRRGDLEIDPGFDGEFGKVRIWPPNGCNG